MTDIFGYEKNTSASGTIITSEFASLSIGGRVSLTQNVSGQYGRQVRTMYESGSSNVYFLHGNSTGNITCSAAVGSKGFFNALNSTLAKCGKVDSISVDILPGGKCSTSTGGKGGLTFSGGMVEGLQFAFQTGLEAVTEGFTIMVAEMNKK